MPNDVQAFSSGSTSGPDSEGRIMVRCRICGKDVVRMESQQGVRTVICAECHADETEQNVERIMQPLVLHPTQEDLPAFRVMGFGTAQTPAVESTTEAKKRKRKPLLER